MGAKGTPKSMISKITDFYAWLSVSTVGSKVNARFWVPFFVVILQRIEQRDTEMSSRLTMLVVFSLQTSLKLNQIQETALFPEKHIKNIQLSVNKETFNFSEHLKLNSHIFARFWDMPNKVINRRFPNVENLIADCSNLLSGYGKINRLYCEKQFYRI